MELQTDTFSLRKKKTEVSETLVEKMLKSYSRVSFALFLFDLSNKKLLHLQDTLKWRFH
jgi:hypothetical protein